MSLLDIAILRNWGEYVALFLFCEIELIHPPKSHFSRTKNMPLTRLNNIETYDWKAHMAFWMDCWH
eukprot:scaffold12435_cov33-Cyclotella_meneghiniana.AAC.3